MLTFKIAELLNQPVGTIESYEINAQPVFPAEDFKLTDKILSDLDLIRIEDGVVAVLKDLTATVALICNKCLEKFTYTIKIPQTERQFLLKIAAEDQSEHFLIDKKNLTIDLTEMIRQEIILHFPVIPVCSKSCKGLCQNCGTNLNKKTCTCHKNPTDTENQKPFKDLKKLLENCS